MTLPIGPYRDGRIHVLNERCSSCVFRPGNLMDLGIGRLADLVRSNLEADSVLTCHQTLPYGPHPEAPPSVCHGYFDAYWREVTGLRMAVALDLIEFEAPPPERTT